MGTTAAFPDGCVYRGLAAFRGYCGEVLARWGEDEHSLQFREGQIVRGRNFTSFDAAVESLGGAQLSPL